MSTGQVIAHGTLRGTHRANPTILEAGRISIYDKPDENHFRPSKAARKSGKSPTGFHGCQDRAQRSGADQEDTRKDYGEQRFQTVGFLAGRMVMVVWTPRDKTTHVISMRKCNVKEQARYTKRFEEN
jgi:uncharacterized DUF497 family protein